MTNATKRRTILADNFGHIIERIQFMLLCWDWAPLRMFFQWFCLFEKFSKRLRLSLSSERSLSVLPKVNYLHKCRMNVKFMLVFYGKVQVIGIVSFTCDSCHSIELNSFSLNKSYKFENFLVKVEEDLIFLSIAFFNVERMISYLVAISKLSQNTFCFCL